MNELKLLGIEELAAVLHRSPKTVRSDVTRRPETLPPRVREAEDKYKPLGDDCDRRKWEAVRRLWK